MSGDIIQALLICIVVAGIMFYLLRMAFSKAQLENTSLKEGLDKKQRQKKIEENFDAIVFCSKCNKEVKRAELAYYNDKENICKECWNDDEV